MHTGIGDNVQTGLLRANNLLFEYSDSLPCEKDQNEEFHTILQTYIPNSDTKRPARMSQLCHGSCEPCHTFPTIILACSMSNK